MFATDGTREHLAADGIEVRSVSDLTGVPPLVGGQVKTFHPAVYAGILARRDDPGPARGADGAGHRPDRPRRRQREAVRAGGRARQLVGIDEALEMVDVGGVALLGAAARNCAGVAAVAQPAPLPAARRASCRSWARCRAELRQRLAAEAFGAVAAYHAEIAAYLHQASGDIFPPRLALVLEKVRDLPLRREPAPAGGVLPRDDAPQRHARRRDHSQGDGPSFNNLLDLDAAYRIAPRLHGAHGRDRQAHGPGRASRRTTSWSRRTGRRSRRTPVAAFGGIVGVNRQLDGATAREIAANSYEAVDRARRTATRPSGSSRQKAGLEIIAVPPDPTEGLRDYGIATLDFQRVAGGLLVETQDELGLDRGQLQVVTKRRPTLEELTDLLFAWRAVRHVRSNAIVLAKNARDDRRRRRPGSRAGVGRDRAAPGRRSGEARGHGVGRVFPVPGRHPAAAHAGVTAIIQPGGSIRDEMAIEVADRHHLAMVFTGRRHFRQ